MRLPAGGISVVVTGQLGAAALLCSAIEIAGPAARHAQTAYSPMLEVPARGVPVASTVSPQIAGFFDKHLGR